MKKFVKFVFTWFVKLSDEFDMWKQTLIFVEKKSGFVVLGFGVWSDEQDLDWVVPGFFLQTFALR